MDTPDAGFQRLGALPSDDGLSATPDAELDPEQRGRELGLLEEAARLLAAADHIDDVHAVIVRAAALIVATSRRRWRASFLALDGDRLRRAAMYDDAGIDIASLDYPLDAYPALRHVVETRRQLYGDPGVLSSGIPEEVAGSVRTQGVAYAVLTPVAHAGEVFGILALSTRDGSKHHDIPVKRLQAVAHVGALAIANARYLSEQRNVAERAQALELAKTRFLNLAAHELRGPITVLHGYLSMLADGSLPLAPAAAGGMVAVLLAKTAEMNRIVEAMLESVRVEEGRLDLRRARLDLRDVVTKAVSTISPLLGDGRVRLTNCDTPLLVDGDRDRLGTVVMNLLDNAGKYSAPTSRIDVVCDAVGGNLATVSIKDRGIGLSPDEQAVLFNRFGRVPSSLTSHIPGSGLGLWLSREIARLHGGDIDVVSDVESGSTFTLVLPLDAPVESAAAVGEGVSTTMSAERRPEPDGGSRVTRLFKSLAILASSLLVNVSSA